MDGMLAAIRSAVAPLAADLAAAKAEIIRKHELATDYYAVMDSALRESDALRSRLESEIKCHERAFRRAEEQNARAFHAESDLAAIKKERQEFIDAAIRAQFHREALEADLAAAVKVVEAARHEGPHWYASVRLAIQAFDARKKEPAP